MQTLIDNLIGRMFQKGKYHTQGCGGAGTRGNSVPTLFWVREHVPTLFSGFPLYCNESEYFITKADLKMRRKCCWKCWIFGCIPTLPF